MEIVEVTFLETMFIFAIGAMPWVFLTPNDILTRCWSGPLVLGTLSPLFDRYS